MALDIVFITDRLARGGAETQLTRIALSFKRRGWRVGIITMFPSLDFRDDLEKAGIPVVECSKGMPWFPNLPLLMSFRMLRQLRRWRPSALITFNYHSDIMGRVLGRIAGVKAIISSLRTANLKTPLRGKLYRATEKLIDLTISNSHAAISYMLAREVLTPEKTAVIPNGITVSSFPHPISREEARAEYNLPPETFVWLAVGNLTPAKDYPTLLEAVERCFASPRDFRVLIAGAGAMLDFLLAEAERRGISDKVHFLGARTDVPRLLRACDAFVLSSAWEGLPNTVMEAMASGVPVVSTDAGGVRELMGPDASGCIAPFGNPTALSECMIKLMNLSAEDLLRMGTTGRERIARHFNLDGVVDRWEAVIRQVIRASGISQPALYPPGYREPIIQPECTPRVEIPPPGFIISMDFELMWGMRDKRTIQTYGDRVFGERLAIPAMLEIFNRYKVKATWAMVGMAMFERKRDLLACLPDQRPTYALTRLNPYLAMEEVGENEKEDPYHFGSSLVRQILDCEDMELGSHTFSHYYCLENGQDSTHFKADMEASVEAMNRFNVRPTSFVFPRNQYNYHYLRICSDLGFTVFRGNESSWMYDASSIEDFALLKRMARLADHYLNLTGDHGFIPRRFLDFDMANCPSSRFLRPFHPRLSSLEGLRVRRIQGAMEQAARKGESFHLWWHPHNFGANLQENLAILEELLRFHVILRDRYGVVPMTMGEAGQIALAAHGAP